MEQAVRKATEDPKRRSRTRTALIEAAKRLMSKRPGGGFSIDEVIREAVVARGSFYNHFAGIDALVEHTLTTVQDDLYACISASAEGSTDAPTILARGVATTLRFGYSSPSSARVLLHIEPGLADPGAHGSEQLSRTLALGLAGGQFKLPSLDVGVVSVLGICAMGLSRMLDLHHEYTAVRELTQGLCVAVLRSVSVDARRIDKLARDAVLVCFEVPLGR